MESSGRRKVTAKVHPGNLEGSSRPSSRNSSRSRPGSPLRTYTASPSSLSPPDVLRPKAKVNSSATIGRKPSTISSVSGSSKTSSVLSITPRANSPFKHPTTRNGAVSPPVQGVKARVTIHPSTKANGLTPISTLSESRQRSLTAVAADLLQPASSRRRQGSFTLHRTGSFSSFQPRASSESAPPEVFSNSENDRNDLPVQQPTKIKSKVSGLAKSTFEGSVSLPPSPLYATTRPIHVRTRAPSISSPIFVQNSSPPSPDQTFYPITTATPAANPHRFATPRSSPPSKQHQFRPFPNTDDLAVRYNRAVIAPQVDPHTIPLPAHSPPTSTLSFSSRSSQSRSSLSLQTDSSMESKNTVPTVGSHSRGGSEEFKRRISYLRTSLDKVASTSAAIYGAENGNGSLIAELDDGQNSAEEATDTDMDASADSGGSEHQVKAEAKSNRKIADLEITNRSLLAINTQLETTKHRQAKEIRELRRKLRESRLILPPRAFREVKSSLDHDDTAEDDEDEDDLDRADTEDEAFRRVKVMLEGLLNSGKRALEAKPEDFKEGGKGGTKVLHADEVRNWRDFDERDQEDADKTVDFEVEPRISPSLVAMPDNDNEFTSGDEVVVAVSEPYILPPPITITPSP